MFVNAENVTDVRQTRWDSLLRPSPGADGRWTVDAWAPLDGRVFNGGVRLDF
jgi:outer membrane receptor for ferrienterochelin and colicins